jgi:competence ComEA-like helix-hairpin-helix protein
MEPSAPSPWRVLETPAAGERLDRLGTQQQPAGVGATQSTLPKMLVIIGLAVACGIAAFFLAVGDGSGAVRIDGGTGLDHVASAVPGGSLDLVIGGAGGELVVEIVGAVQRPGVYRMPPGSRVGDLLDAAGGYGPRIDTSQAERALNLAAPLGDGDQVRVPSRDDPAATGRGPSASSRVAAGAAIDLNTASQAELEALPGVGPATAGKIIAARDEAPFGAVEELRSRGILGEKTFEKLRDLVTVG